MMLQCRPVLATPRRGGQGTIALMLMGMPLGHHQLAYQGDASAHANLSAVIRTPAASHHCLISCAAVWPPHTGQPGALAHLLRAHTQAGQQYAEHAVLQADP